MRTELTSAQIQQIKSELNSVKPDFAKFLRDEISGEELNKLIEEKTKSTLTHLAFIGYGIWFLNLIEDIITERDPQLIKQLYSQKIINIITPN